MDKSNKLNHFDYIVIGGGFYGCSIALLLRQYFGRVAIIESGSTLLGQASLKNQARVHQGYHYPRSHMTALRSRANYYRFIRDFAGCIDYTFEKFYAIAKQNSKVTSNQFEIFCQSIGAPLKVAPDSIKKLVNTQLIEEVFSVEEVAFDAVKLSQQLHNQLLESGVTIIFDQNIQQVDTAPDGKLIATSTSTNFEATHIINCTYSGINSVLLNSRLDPLPIKYELAELAIVDVPEILKDKGFTIMDGPFFSLMPYPSKKLHSLSHVRYTPIQDWTDQQLPSAQKINAGPWPTNYPFMAKDAARYIPITAQMQHIESIYAAKALLVQHEVDDGRPILYRENYGLNNFSVVLGGKIDNIYDITALLTQRLTHASQASTITGG